MSYIQDATARTCTVQYHGETCKAFRWEFLSGTRSNLRSGKDSSRQQVTWAHFAAAFNAPRRSESCTRSKAGATMSRRHLNRQLMPEVRPHPEVEANDLPRRRLVLDSPYERSGRHPRRDSACAQRAAHQTIRARSDRSRKRLPLSAPWPYESSGSVVEFDPPVIGSNRAVEVGGSSTPLIARAARHSARLEGRSTEPSPEPQQHGSWPGGPGLRIEGCGDAPKDARMRVRVRSPWGRRRR